MDDMAEMSLDDGSSGALDAADPHTGDPHAGDYWHDPSFLAGHPAADGPLASAPHGPQHDPHADPHHDPPGQDPAPGAEGPGDDRFEGHEHDLPPAGHGGAGDHHSGGHGHDSDHHRPHRPSGSSSASPASDHQHLDPHHRTPDSAPEQHAPPPGAHLQMDIDGVHYDTGRADLDATGDGHADTSVLHTERAGVDQVEYYTDNDGDGRADELTITGADGHLISHTELDPTTGQWTETPLDHRLPTELPDR